MRSDLEPRLRGLYREPLAGQQAHLAAGEDELLAALAPAARERAAAAGSGGRGSGWPRLPRFALGALLGVAVAVGACVMPVEYPVSLGHGLEITIAADRFDQLDPEAIAAHLSESLDPERLEIRVERVRRELAAEDGTVRTSDDVRLELFVLGEDIDPALVLDDLRREFPLLAEAELADVPLSGTVHGTFGGALSHRFLDLTIDRHGVEEAERRLLDELVAQGLPREHTKVDITDEQGPDGRRRVEVRVEAEQ